MKRIAVLLAAIFILSSASFAATGGITAVNVDVGGLPSLRMAMSKDMTIDLGVGYVQTAANTSTLGAMVRLNNKLFAVSKTATVIWGGNLTFGSTTTAGVGTSTIAVNGTVGAEVKFTPDFAGYAIVNVIGLSSSAGTTLINLLSGSAVAYTGLTLYL